MALSVVLTSACGVSATITTPSGPIVGHTDGNGADAVSRFVGIPYAQPPVGSLRWRPPAELAPWTEPLDATQSGSPCPQAAGVSGAGSHDEDCLRLHVWTPRAASGLGLPVMVFIHGGAFSSGSGGESLYDGSYLARKGQVVVVTLNYRLGQLGYLAHEALAAEDEHHSAGNYGLLDQQMALKWVQKNIDSFGGAPGNVTVFGESAGAFSVCMHLASPLATGLFQRAIGESGACMLSAMPLRDDPLQPNQSAESLGRTFAAALGCDAAVDVAACMRGKTPDEVLAAAPVALSLDMTKAQYAPNLDGWVLPARLQESFRDRRFQSVPFLTGVNKDEGTLFALDIHVSSRADFEDYVRTVVPHHVDSALSLFSVARYGDPRAALTAFVGDFGFVCHARLQARLVAAAGAGTWLYYFTREQLIGTLTGLGVFHSTELAYVFHNFTPPFVSSPGDDALSDEMIGYWTRFAATGDPNSPGVPAWPRLTSRSDYLQLDSTLQAGVDLDAANCDTVETWYPNP